MIKWLTVILLAMSPIWELRAAIPTGIAMDLNPVAVMFVSILFNMLAFVPIYLALDMFYKRFKKIEFIETYVEKIRRKAQGTVKKYGIIGLALFVGVPLPGTGVWTGTIAAWILGLDWRKSFTAICIGTIIAGVIVFIGSVWTVFLF